MNFHYRRVGSARFEVRLSAFDEFKVYIETAIPPSERHVYRGHLSSDWRLQPSLFRRLGVPADSQVKALAAEQLMLFKDKAREHTDLPQDSPDNDWWALGQHMGLRTPLLDWSTSPYVAMFFAFADIDEYEHWTENRVIYALNRDAIESKNAESPFEPGDHDHLLEFIEPPTDENRRLACQSGLLTLSPAWAEIEYMVEMDFEDEPDRRVLTRILLPDAQRVACLRALDDIEINHVNLFPDLGGAAMSCNLSHDLKHAAPPKPLDAPPIEGSV